MKAMFTNINWTDYFIAIILLLIIYYPFIGIRFYYQELKNLISRLKLKEAPATESYSYGNEPDRPDISDFENHKQTTEEDPFQEVEHLVNRIKEVVKDASDRKADKEQFSKYMYLLLKEYPALKASPFQSAINELICSECEKYGSLILSEDEAVKLWDEV